MTKSPSYKKIISAVLGVGARSAVQFPNSRTAVVVGCCSAVVACGSAVVAVVVVVTGDCGVGGVVAVVDGDGVAVAPVVGIS